MSQPSGARKRSEKEIQARKRRRRKKRIYRYVSRTMLCILTAVVVLLVGAYSLLGVIFLGPSQTCSDQLTMTLLETSAAKFVPTLYYSSLEMELIRERNRVIEPEEITDASLLNFNQTNEDAADEEGEEDETAADIVVEEITGPTYHGWMMIVQDPSRVMLGVSQEKFNKKDRGMRIAEMAQKYEAVAAINGGAFWDDGGSGNGGMPKGLTISEGKIRVYEKDSSLTTAGFTEDNVLVVGRFTEEEAMRLGIRDACSFGPALVVNNEPAQVAGASSGLNPRTAIGQRADGAVLMLVIDGRQVNSPGASMADLVEIMVRYGAVNACNLDGGSSSNMY